MTTSKDLTQALHDLTEQANAPKERPKARGAAPKSRSASQPGGSAGRSSGSIASPLQEGSVYTREYWPGKWKTSDGLFEFPAIKEVSFTDANGDTVIMRFASPA